MTGTGTGPGTGPGTGLGPGPETFSAYNCGKSAKDRDTFPIGVLVCCLRRYSIGVKKTLNILQTTSKTRPLPTSRV